MSIQQIRYNLDRIINYLSPFESFYNCHMVNFLTDKHWENFIPENIRNNLKNKYEINEAINDIWWNRNENTKFVNLLKFVQESEKYYLENLNLITPLEDVLNIEGGDGKKITEPVPIKEFMSEKKRHEVEIMAKTVKCLIDSQNNSNFIVVDAGDGKGYLSSRLALEYNLKVLGIDANQLNTETAKQRNQKLQKAWNGLTKRAELINQGITPPRRGKSSSSSSSKIQLNLKNLNENKNYKTINEFITENLNLKKLINDNFPEYSENNLQSICLTGLHTCGNLASTCLKVFNTQNSIKILCNVGCCYHLLKEEFYIDEFFFNKKIYTKNLDYGFPLSKYLKNKKFKLGRNARMLASQSIQRTCLKHELSTESLFYRALLEILIIQIKPELKNQIQVGKIRKFSTFYDYLLKCDEKLNLNLKDHIQDDYLQSLIEKYENDRYFLKIFYLIRMKFSIILETIILLDRLLYLKEASYENSFIVKLFDSVISPRCYGIISVKR